MNPINKLTGQQELLEKIISIVSETDQNNLFVVRGGLGHGKTHFCLKLKDELEERLFKVFFLKYTEHSFSSEYAPFYNGAYDSSNLYRDQKILDIIAGGAKFIPAAGNALSDILKTLKEATNFQDIRYSEVECGIIDIYWNLIKKNEKILFICDDFDKWSLESQRLLFNFINNQIVKPEFEHLNFLLTVSSSNGKFGNNLNSCKKNIYEYELSSIPNENLSEILRFLKANLKLSEEQSNSLGDIVNGNIRFLEDIATKNYDTVKDIINSNYYEYLLAKIDNASDDKKDTLEFLKRTAIVNDPIHKNILKNFLGNDERLYSERIFESNELSILKEEDPHIKFLNKDIKRLFQSKISSRERWYYSELEKIFRLLYPTNYLNRAICLFKAGEKNEAISIFIVYFIQLFRKNNVLKSEFEVKRELQRVFHLEEFQDFYEYLQFYQDYCECFIFYQKGMYEESIELINKFYISLNNQLFRFELDYLHALNMTNYSSDKKTFIEELINLEIWIDSNGFKEQEPEMWLRSSMLLLEYYLETDELGKLNNTRKKIQNFCQTNMDIDRNLKQTYCMLQMKANVYTNIENAYSQTEQAKEFWEQSENATEDLSKYYISLINHGANALILGKMAICADSLYNALMLINKFPDILFPKLETLFNNYIIFQYSTEKITSIEATSHFLELTETINDCADMLLIKNNLAALKFLSGQVDDATDLIRELFSQVSEDTDAYYFYFVANNYAVINYLNGETSLGIEIMEKLVLVTPMENDKKYFKVRTEQLLLAMKNNQLISSSSMNDYLYSIDRYKVGNAWKFWSKTLLLSELQIWSDCY